MSENHFLVNWGLVRLALFGKNAMDRHSLRSNLSVHVVSSYWKKKVRVVLNVFYLLAPFMAFYAIQLKADGLYTMAELARVQFPMSILELPSILYKLYAPQKDLIQCVP
ncbi:uncharacterized protein RHIMIDRAFT_3156 [Rhizopus microsporus ATCC 52813]|uniref:Uncharacterized protein n=1 Tax=Rhizopus microsporus ATCC 52813 TaxID=1340429 RepID=A0A2G4T7W4_RHIZD|nr:uncharacterized protein RHIMIDRAFT_3156 [Rhizopus microsporus ATCC 52813]PHZ17103.1 hypothetical protein RHIMIDRAFT_3156 [Rhizopus microsporus ATCC 52813]